MDINDIIKEAHENAIKKGFYDCPECEGKGEVLTSGDIYSGEPKEMPDTCSMCKGTGKDSNRNISELLMLIVSELGEAQEALRNKKFNRFEIGFDWYNYLIRLADEETYQLEFEDTIKDTFEDELADVFIRLADLCGYLNIDIEKHIIAKMQYNKLRPRKHGKKF